MFLRIESVRSPTFHDAPVSASAPSNCVAPVVLKPRQYSLQLDQLEREELKNSMESLLSTLKCPVCLVLVEKDSVLCVNGHAVCKKCRGNQNSCPTCRNSFSNLQKNAIFSQILEIVPHRCRFDKCTQLVKSGEDHEDYCRFRPTWCKYSGCQWVGSVDNLAFHLEDKHPQEKVVSGNKNLVKVSKNFVDSNGTLLFSSCGHYFWQLKDGSGESVWFIYLPVWVGKPTRDIYMRIWFKSEEREYDTGIKMKLNNNNDAARADRFVFSDSMITNFYNGNELKYYLMITEVRNEAVNMLLE